MLQSYEAIYEHGQMKWLGDCPPVEEARVIVTILSSKDNTPASGARRKPAMRTVEKNGDLLTRHTIGADLVRRRPPPELAGGEILGDIMVPTTEDSDWDALK